MDEDIKWPGTWLIQNDAPAAVPQIPNDRPFYIQQFTDEPSDEPVLNDNCQSLQDVFDTFQPSKTMDMYDGDLPVEQKLVFKSMMDFGSKGIINQSDFLKEKNEEKELYTDFEKSLANNQLALLLSNPESKAAYLKMLENLIEELAAADLEE